MAGADQREEAGPAQRARPTAIADAGDAARAGQGRTGERGERAQQGR
ncbi:MAG TPA: hypothetical protein VFS21_30935 [Roseiflexaceae bacterium]|nr:hypothetical protein [Roseiflexaceae bacterium]